MPDNESKKDANVKYARDTNDESEQAKEDLTALRAIIRRTPGRQYVNSLDVPDVSAEAKRIAKTFNQLFGRQVVYFRGAGTYALPRGRVGLKNLDVIYVNAESGYAPSNIIGHELVHILNKIRHSDIVVPFDYTNI